MSLYNLDFLFGRFLRLKNVQTESWRCELEEYKNEFLDVLVGRSVLVRPLTGPALDEEFVATLDEDPTAILTQPLHSRTAVFALESYDRVGLTPKPVNVRQLQFKRWGIS